MAFDRDREGRGRSFGRRDFGGGGGGRFDRPREMTKVTCSNCGKETEVPFKPTGDRPVYCRDCFAKMGGAEPRRSFGGDRRDSRPPFRKFDDNRPQGPSNSIQLSEINAKLDQLIKLLTPGSAPLTTSKEKVKPVVEKPAKETRSASSGRVKVVKAKKTVKKVAKAPAETPIEEAPEE